MSSASASSAIDVSWLFETNALKIAPADRPFWYTSGLIGPYFINTHFLCGGEDRAKELLSFIDQHQDDPKTFPAKIVEQLEDVYENHTIFRGTIDAFVETANQNIPTDEISFISGGQRRDWFFSPIIAKRLEKPCCYIYNDRKIFDQYGTPVVEASGSKVLHIADLLTVASSYTEKWIPAIADLGASMEWSINAVDRAEGGADNIRNAGVPYVAALISLSMEMFKIARERDYISDDQLKIVSRYAKDPFESMRSFLLNSPAFLEEAKASADKKTAERAAKLVEQDLYKLNAGA